MGHYRQDLAYIHDTGFSDFAERSAPGLLTLLRQRGVTKGLVVDVGCGSGIWARRLVDAGYQVLGIDLSRSMTALAKQRVPEGTFRVGSFLDAILPDCAAVTSIGECLGYAVDRRIGKGHLSRFFRRVYHALLPGGVFIFDLRELRKNAPRGPQTGFWEGDDWAALVETEEKAARKELWRRITTFRKRGKLYRRDSEKHRLNLFESREVLRKLRDTGFRAQLVRGYGEFRFEGPQIGFVARRP